MGTFHEDRGELHGVTVVVDTHGSHIYVGRCDVADENAIVLLGVDVHEDGHEGRSKEDFVRQVAKFGIWPKQARVVVSRSDVASIRHLGSIVAD